MPRVVGTRRIAHAALAASFVALLPRCRASDEPCDACAEERAPADGTYDVVVVGSGAGGGPVAARLARAGKRVLLLEAGEDAGESLRYRVPAMHALATEDPALAWWFFVSHSADPAVDATDSKITKQVLYPRGSALGGSTAVNAMVTVLPSPADWNRLAEVTGDAGFRARAMAPYEARVREWLSVEIPEPSLATSDRAVSGTLTAAVTTLARRDGALDPLDAAGALATLLTKDVNEALASGEASGVYRLPLATRGGARNGTRELLRATVAAGYPLTIATGAFVTKVLWDEDASTPTAVGVEYVERAHVYGASLAQVRAPSERRTAFARQEVVVSAGAFNSPQILMLSGVGDPAALRAHGITPVLARRGVGKNLQDRVEAAVVTSYAPLAIVAKCALGAPASTDPCLSDWESGRGGVYTTPGFLAAAFVRSSEATPVTDLAIFAVPSDARGYYPGYAEDGARAKDRLTWLLLKAHTKNRDGAVTLASADPFARPTIAFRSFDEKDPLHDPDLRAVVEGVKIVRRIEDEARSILRDDVEGEIWPGPSVASDDQIAAFVRKEAWGHHACCTDEMGDPSDDDAVVDARFRVIGASHLRVVDASVFREIPGTFLAMPLYMLAERAADVILEDDR